MKRKNAFGDFDRDFNRAQKFIYINLVISVIVGLTLTGFGVWAVVMLLRFFGVV